MRRALSLAVTLLALSAGPAFGGSVTGDFDGDGKADLAVGSPTEDLGLLTDAGAVNVIYGAPRGLGASARNQLFTQSSPGILESAEAYDEFGHALAAGDFNNDGFSDLAVGVPSEDFGTNTDLGVVHVIYGSPDGLDSDAPGMEAETFSTDPVSYQDYQLFGFSLAAANFGNGAADDLAVASPADDFGADVNGSVSIFYGNDTGIDLATTAVFGQATEGVPGDPNNSERFGYALVAGKFGQSGHADLAVGVPEDDVEGVADAGAVNVLYGSPSGIGTDGSQRWAQDSAGIAGRGEAFEGFGGSLAAGDLGKSGQADLAIAAPCESLGTVPCAGGVNVLYGTPAGLSAHGDQHWSQAAPGVRGTPGPSEGFGLAMTVADFGRSGRADLAIGVAEKVDGESFAGAVQILYGAAGGLNAHGDQLFSKATAGIAGAADTADGFGRALGAGNFGRGRYADLAVGIPNETRGGVQYSGAVQLLYGRSSGLGVAHAEVLDQDSPRVLETREENDGFGSAFAPRGSNLGIRFLS